MAEFNEGRIRTSAMFCTTSATRRRTLLYPGARTRDPAPPARFLGGENCSVQRGRSPHGYWGLARFGSPLISCDSMHIPCASTRFHIGDLCRFLVGSVKPLSKRLFFCGLMKFDAKTIGIFAEQGARAG